MRARATRVAAPSFPRVLSIVAALLSVAWSGCRSGGADLTPAAALVAPGDGSPQTFARAEDAAWAVVAWLRNGDAGQADSPLGALAERSLERRGFDASMRAAFGDASRDGAFVDFVDESTVFVRVGMISRRVPISIVRCGSRWCLRGDEAEPCPVFTPG